jgi:hypothetical protein
VEASEWGEATVRGAVELIQGISLNFSHSLSWTNWSSLENRSCNFHQCEAKALPSVPGHLTEQSSKDAENGAYAIFYIAEANPFFTHRRFPP